MEYLIGDGPQNRYALICAQCQSHNGMALREEFEYIGKKFQAVCSDIGY
jgi:endoplasmic reticulum junction formation protein lunapark